MTDERHTSFMDALAALNRHYLVGVPEAREVWLVRHADAYAGLERLADGRIDPPLSPVGRAQAARLAERLLPVPVDAVWCSDLLRARETAEPIAADHGLELHCDPRLQEVRTHWTRAPRNPNWAAATTPSRSRPRRPSRGWRRRSRISSAPCPSTPTGGPGRWW